MRVTLSPLAERDLETIGDYIAEDNPLRALTLVHFTVVRVLHGAMDIPAHFPDSTECPTRYSGEVMPYIGTIMLEFSICQLPQPFFPIAKLESFAGFSASRSAAFI